MSSVMKQSRRVGADTMSPQSWPAFMETGMDKGLVPGRDTDDLAVSWSRLSVDTIWTLDMNV